MSEVFHVGDSVSDIPLFEAVGYSIALNANQQAKDKAHTTLDSDSLFEIIVLILASMRRRIVLAESVVLSGQALPGRARASMTSSG
ncbi:MAG TPA: HAD hydrolase family protein [Pseudomonas sp.]|jgi:predicted HAD superfamily phosphohydrolase|uniref:HAD hydrolase family protein n=1 Tax=Pseudomonas sp. TaxID=306 RepID=UPI002ED77EFC